MSTSTEDELRAALAQAALVQLPSGRASEPGFERALDEAALMLARVDALELPVFGGPDFSEAGGWA